MNEYEVVWRITCEADSVEEAAQVALGIQRDPESAAAHFEVVNTATGKSARIYINPKR